LSLIRNGRMRATTHGGDWPDATSTGNIPAAKPSSRLSRNSDTSK
jgi:hypothetical protein